jgi:hypothetical protein
MIGTRTISTAPVAADPMSAYPSAMRVIAASLLLAGLVGTAAVAEERVPLYTNEDLDRMFGPPPAPVSDPVDKSGPEDWGWVENYLDRQYARIDADRQYELQKRTLDIAEERTYTGHYGGYYGGYAAFGLGYPASTWWNNVSRIYRGGGNHQVQPIGDHQVLPIRRGIPSGRGTRPPTGSSSGPSPRSGARAPAKAP